MSDLIRMLGMKMSRKGTCNKCGEPRDKGNHSKCDRWPTKYGGSKGFTCVSNSRESSLANLQEIVKAICAGDDPRTPVRFELRILQTRALNDAPEKEGKTKQ